MGGYTQGVSGSGILVPSLVIILRTISEQNPGWRTIVLDLELPHKFYDGPYGKAAVNIAMIGEFRTLN